MYLAARRSPLLAALLLAPLFVLGAAGARAGGPVAVRWPWNPLERACVGPWAAYRVESKLTQRVRTAPECEPWAGLRTFVRVEIAALSSSAIDVRWTKATNEGDRSSLDLPVPRHLPPEVPVVCEYITRIERDAAVIAFQPAERVIAGRRVPCLELVVAGLSFDRLPQKLTLWLAPEVEGLGLVGAEAEWQRARDAFQPVGPGGSAGVDPTPDQGALTLELAGEGGIQDEATWGKTLEALVSEATPKDDAAK